MIKQTAIRIPPELASEIEYVARIPNTSVNSLIIEAVQSFLSGIADDPDFSRRAREILSEDSEILDRLLKGNSES